jgi:hypothetical protein
MVASCFVAAYHNGRLISDLPGIRRHYLGRRCAHTHAGACRAGWPQRVTLLGR